LKQQVNGERSLKKFYLSLASNQQEQIRAFLLRIMMDARKHTSSFMLPMVESSQMKKKSNIALSKVFVVKDLGQIDTFIGCKIIETEEKDTIWILIKPN
jgi:hypothetical protein